MVIDNFKLPGYEFLSNFYMCDITYDGIDYTSTEHAYQAAKTFDYEERYLIAGMKTPGETRRYGRKIKHLRPDWDVIRYNIMFQLLYQKFTRHVDLGIKLINTFPYELIEGNWWGDVYWGVCKGVGENNLGKQLMLIRKNLMKIKNG